VTAISGGLKSWTADHIVWFFRQKSGMEIDNLSNPELEKTMGSEKDTNILWVPHFIDIFHFLYYIKRQG